jgi:hypothetical protein
MRLHCAWCNLDMGQKEPPEDENWTYGICQSCCNHFFREAEQDADKDNRSRLAPVQEPAGVVRVQCAIPDVKCRSPTP